MSKTAASAEARSIPRFTFRQLHYFAAAARCEQISVAAAEVGVSQSAMTLAIAELERSVGATLFERGRLGVSLTFEGQAFLQQAEGLLHAAQEASRLPFHRPAGLSGRLELAATYTVQGYFLMPMVARFRKLFPNVEVVPIELQRPEIESRLRDGSLELAVVLLSNLESRMGFATRMLASSRRQVWVSHNHPLAGRSVVTWTDLAPYPYIVPMMDEADRNSKRYWQQAGLEPASWIRTSSMEALREMVALGLGVTILSDMVYRTWSLDGRRIQPLPLDQHLPVMEIGLAWRTSPVLSTCAAAFREFLGRNGPQAPDVADAG
ncbi:LysR family transcriptional regulator [Paucibacter sp. R3-3]|uniref:LysR family transcriptional regulator n=1 Tax=Roseateles agri TaxID=3098619 RepID=A0ABU5DSU9_9BURK|nr:LysR family transcriptional regulator [Paucibacter sp. R3-3]MDY0748197.1 LysR family transcriptional regulator [Paucibacter sp. R3-3]